MLNSKEQVLYYFLYHDIRLNVYDKKFLTNLENLIKSTKRVTTNQKKLFEKIIEKYRKQLSKKNLDSKLLVSLPWSTPIVESDLKYTNAQVSIENDKLYLRTPFNRNFISFFRDYPDNTFTWVREKKSYVSNINSHSFKILVKTLPKYFSNVTYNKPAQEYMDNLNKFYAKIWEPTLVKVHNFYIIAAINVSLYESTKNLILDNRAKNLFELSQFGVKVDQSIIKNNAKKVFAATQRPSIDIKHFSRCVKWLKEFGINVAYLGKSISGVQSLGELLASKANYTSKLYSRIEIPLSRYNIQCVKNGNYFFDKQHYCPSVAIQTIRNIKPIYYKNNKPICKYITVLNSQEIEVI